MQSQGASLREYHASATTLRPTFRNQAGTHRRLIWRAIDALLSRLGRRLAGRLTLRGRAYLSVVDDAGHVRCRNRFADKVAL